MTSLWTVVIWFNDTNADTMYYGTHEAKALEVFEWIVGTHGDGVAPGEPKAECVALCCDGILVDISAL